MDWIGRFRPQLTLELLENSALGSVQRKNIERLTLKLAQSISYAY